MSIDWDPEEVAVSELSVALAVHLGMTKSVFKVKERASLTFKNKSHDKTLTIKSTDSPPPFEVPGCAQPQSQFTVAAKSNLMVRVSAAYTAPSQFAYSAQIEGSIPEDPIVIVDRR